MMKPKILISACLLGSKVRYDGGDCEQDSSILRQWISENRLVSICPEMAGGLPAPRPPAEIIHGKVVTNNGEDVTSEFQKGAEKALDLCHKHQIKIAILKSKSPSCGNEFIYDGTFTRTQIPGAGITADLLQKHGIRVFNENQLEEAALFLQEIEG